MAEQRQHAIRRNAILFQIDRNSHQFGINLDGTLGISLHNDTMNILKAQFSTIKHFQREKKLKHNIFHKTLSYRAGGSHKDGITFQRPFFSCAWTG